MAVQPTASVADLQALQRVFAFYKRGSGSHLPSGCAQLELVDEDDLTNWFVQLRYTDENNADFFVSLRLCFLSSGVSSLTSSDGGVSSTTSSSPPAAAPVVLTTRMPLVFVISPRLIASFIHHGAICSLELMSTAWSLTPTNMSLLLLALYETLNPFARGSRVSVDDAERGRSRRAAAAAESRGLGASSSATDTNAYTEEEHAYGIAYIRKAHPHLFRAAAGADRTAIAPLLEDSDDGESGEAGQKRVASVADVQPLARLSPSAAALAERPQAAPPPPLWTRSLKTFVDVRDVVVTALADCVASRASSDSEVSVCQIEVCATVESLPDVEMQSAPPSSSSSSSAPAGTAGVDRHVAFRRGRASLPIYASTMWRTIAADALPKTERGACASSPFTSTASRVTPRSLADVPLAYRRCVNDVPQCLVPLWIPARLDAHHQRNEARASSPPPAVRIRLHGRAPRENPMPTEADADAAKHTEADVSRVDIALCLRNVFPSADDDSHWQPLSTPLSSSAAQADAEPEAAEPNASTRGPSTRALPSIVSNVCCTVPAGLTLVLTDLYIYGHLRVLGAIELTRCTLVGSLVVEEAGHVTLNATHLAVCTDELLFWSCAPFEGDMAAGTTTTAAERDDKRTSVVFGPWANTYAGVYGEEGMTTGAAGEGVRSEAGTDGEGGDRRARLPPRVDARPLPLASSQARREGILVLDSASVELDVGTRVTRLASLPTPVCVREDYETMIPTLSSANAAICTTRTSASTREGTKGTMKSGTDDWIPMCCPRTNSLSALRLTAPRVSVLRAFILVSNQGRLRILGTHLNPGVGAERCLFAEQDATVDILDSTIFTGIESGVSIQGCRGHLESVLIIGTAMSTPASALSPVPGGEGEAPGEGGGEARCAGLNVELGGILTARFCVTQHVFFGFSVIAHSVAHLDGCHAENVMNGFTVDASTATLHNCSAQTRHVGAFVLHQAKCVLSDDRWGSFSSRAQHLAETWHRGREAVKRKQYAAIDATATTTTAATDNTMNRNKEKKSWCATEAITAAYDVLPPDQADEAYVAETSQLFGAYFFRASMTRRVGRVDTLQQVSPFHGTAPVKAAADAGAIPPCRGDDVEEENTADDCEDDKDDNEVSATLRVASLWSVFAAADAVGTDGLCVVCAFTGGRFGLEVRGAVVEGSGLTFLDATEAAVYAYDGSSVTLSDTLIWASPLLFHTVRAQRSSLERLDGLDASPPPQANEADRSADQAGGRETDKVDDRTNRCRRRDNDAAPPYQDEGGSGASASPPASGLSPAPASARTCGIKLVASKGDLTQCFVVQCAFAFAAVRAATLQAELCMALRGLNGFTIDASSCLLTHCGADTEQVAVFALNRSVARLIGTPHQSGLGSAERPLPKLICGGFPAMYAGRLYGIEVQSSQLNALGVIVARGADSGFNVHCNSQAVLHRCLVSLSADDVRQFILKQGRHTKSTPAAAHAEMEEEATAETKKQTAAATAAALSYEEAMAQVSVLSVPITRVNTRCTGVKVWAASRCQADEVEVRCAVFAYAAMGPDTSLEARHCAARHVVNGFIVESASAVFAKCSASCSQIGVSVFSNGKCVLRRGTYTSKRHGIESRGGVLQIQGHVKVFGSELVGVLLREQAHLSADRASFLEVKTARPASTGMTTPPRVSTSTRTKRATVAGHNENKDEDDAAQNLLALLAPMDAAPAHESAVFPVCLVLENATAHIHQGDLGGGAACGVRCHAQGQLFLRLTRIADCTTVGLDVLEGGHVQLRSCTVECLGRCAVVVRAGGELRAGRAREDDPVALIEEEQRTTLVNKSRQLFGFGRTERRGVCDCWNAALAWLSRIAALTLPRRFTRSPLSPTAVPIRATTAAPHAGDHDASQGHSPAVQTTPLNNSGTTHTRDNGPGGESRACDKSSQRHAYGERLSAFVPQQAPAERPAPSAWCEWLETVAPDVPRRLSCAEAVGGARLTRTGLTNRSGTGSRHSCGSTVVFVNERESEAMSSADGIDDTSRERALSETQDKVRRQRQEDTEGTQGVRGWSCRPIASLAVIKALVQRWRDRRHTQTRAAQVIASALLSEQLDMMPAFSFDGPGASDAAENTDGGVETTQSADEVQTPSRFSSVWLQREGWKTPVVCSPFSTRTGVRVGEGIADVARHDVVGATTLPVVDTRAHAQTASGHPHQSTHEQGADSAMASSTPSPPRWLVGLSGAFYVHGLCVLERVVVQPSVIALRVRARQQHHTASAAATDRPLSEKDDDAPRGDVSVSSHPTLVSGRATDATRTSPSAIAPSLAHTPAREQHLDSRCRSEVRNVRCSSHANGVVHRHTTTTTSETTETVRAVDSRAAIVTPSEGYRCVAAQADTLLHDECTAMFVAGTLRLEEVVLLTPSVDVPVPHHASCRMKRKETTNDDREDGTDAECVPIIHAVGATAQIRMAHVYVARKQGPLQPLLWPRTSLVFEAAQTGTRWGSSDGDWRSWQTVCAGLHRGTARVANVIPQWHPCVICDARNGAVVYAHDVRPMPTHVSGVFGRAASAEASVHSPSRTPTDACDGKSTPTPETNSTNTTSTHGMMTALFLPPLCGALKLSVRCGGHLSPWRSEDATLRGVSPRKSTTNSAAWVAAPRASAPLTSPRVDGEAAIDDSARPLTCVALSSCVLHHLTAVGPLARVYAHTSVVAGGSGRSAASAVVSMDENAKLMDWACLIANSRTHPLHFH